MSCGSLSVKLIGLFRAARLRREEALFENADPSSSSSKLLKHQKNRERTSRAVKGIYAGVAVAIAECVPLGILQSMHWPLSLIKALLHSVRFGSHAVPARWDRWRDYGNTVIDYFLVPVHHEV